MYHALSELKGGNVPIWGRYHDKILAAPWNYDKEKKNIIPDDPAPLKVVYKIKK